MLFRSEDEDDQKPSGGMTEKTVSTTDPESGMFVKGEHERQFAYEAHTACDKNGFVLAVEVTAGNVHDSVAWDAVYDKVTDEFPEAEYCAMHRHPHLMDPRKQCRSKTAVSQDGISGNRQNSRNYEWT